MNIQSFETTRVLGLASPKEKWHLDVVPMVRHRLYYKEGNDASFQRLQVVWNLCLRLSLLTPAHHFHSSCTNRPFFLVVQVDIILNSHLWDRPIPISELQHTLLPPKCYELGYVPQCYPSFVVLLKDPPLGPLEKFRGTSLHMYLLGLSGLN
jgi:hypothetical protein